MRIPLTLAVAAMTLAAPAVAQAHVTLQPNSAAAGGYTRLDVRVPNERDDAATTKIQLQLPDGFAFASYEPVPGWKVRVQKAKLPEPVKTSRNMAWYPPDFVERIQLIKELQERRFMPLKAIKGLLELEGEATRISAAEVKRRFGLPQEVLDRLAELEVISPNSRGYGASDVRILEAISRFRAGGYDERIGFTVYDTLRYKRAMEELVKEEVEVIMERLGGEVDADRAAQLVEKGAEPLRDLISALHTKALVAELKQQRAARA